MNSSPSGRCTASWCDGGVVADAAEDGAEDAAETGTCKMLTWGYATARNMPLYNIRLRKTLQDSTRHVEHLQILIIIINHLQPITYTQEYCKQQVYGRAGCCRLLLGGLLVSTTVFVMQDSRTYPYIHIYTYGSFSFGLLCVLFTIAESSVITGSRRKAFNMRAWVGARFPRTPAGARHAPQLQMNFTCYDARGPH